MARPSISDIKNRLLGTTRAALALAAQARRTLIGTFSDSVAAQLYLLYSYADSLFGQSHPIDATGTRLDDWGSVLNISRTPASFAEFQVYIQVRTAGATIPAGTELQTADGRIYFVPQTLNFRHAGRQLMTIRSRLLGSNQDIQTFTLPDPLNFLSSIPGIDLVAVPGYVTLQGIGLTVRAEVPGDFSSSSFVGETFSATLNGQKYSYVFEEESGVFFIRAIEWSSKSNLPVGTELTLDNPIPGANVIGLAARLLVPGTDPLPVTTGTDAETDEGYRARIIQFFQRSTWNAGGIDDYIARALEHNLVSYAWIAKDYQTMGQIGLFVLGDQHSPIGAPGILSIKQFFDTWLPVGAQVVIVSPPLVPVDFTIVLTPDTEVNRNAVTANLQSLFLDRAHVRGTVNGDLSENNGAIVLAQFQDAIISPSGVEDYTLTLASDTQSTAFGYRPTADYQILSLGTIKFGE